jgi:hypothetical protein
VLSIKCIEVGERIKEVQVKKSEELCFLKGASRADRVQENKMVEKKFIAFDATAAGHRVSDHRLAWQVTTRVPSNSCFIATEGSPSKCMYRNSVAMVARIEYSSFADLSSATLMFNHSNALQGLCGGAWQAATALK